MPSERFLHLPPEKQKRIAQAARAEMGRVPFSEVSINQIIKAAGIPRGSFYQYFTGKEDLLDYLLWDYRDNMLEVLGKSITRTRGDAFAAFVALFDFTIEYGTRPENEAFCNKIFTENLMHTNNTEEIVRMLNGDWNVMKYRRHFRMDRFRFPDDGDLLLFLEMLIVIFGSCVVEIFRDLSRRKTVEAGFRRKMEILKNGVMKQPEEE